MNIAFGRVYKPVAQLFGLTSVWLSCQLKICHVILSENHLDKFAFCREARDIKDWTSQCSKWHLWVSPEVV